LRRIGKNTDETFDANDVRTFLDQYTQARESASRNGSSLPKWVAVVAHTSAKFGVCWQPAIIWHKARHPLTGKLVNTCACPNCGYIVSAEKDGIIVPATDPAELAEKRQFCRDLLMGDLDRIRLTQSM